MYHCSARSYKKMHRFSARSYKKMAGVRPELIAVATLALSRSKLDFGVTEGVRTIKRQRKLVSSGASRTMNSRHLTGDALDVVVYVNGSVRWDWPLYEQLAVEFKQAAADLNILIVWGGDWPTFRDGPHYELAR